MSTVSPRHSSSLPALSFLAAWLFSFSSFSSGIYQKILGGKIDYPRHMDPHARDLIKKLLTADRTKRFGCLHAGAEDIKQHPWFKGVDWTAMFQRRVRPPFVPAFRAPNDTSNFDRYPDSREGSLQPVLNEKEAALFANF